MVMRNQGRAKLTEECGEMLQVIGKIDQYPDTDEHPDGEGSLRRRLEVEMADLLASCSFVIRKMNLDTDFIKRRAESKLALYEQWDQEA